MQEKILVIQTSFLGDAVLTLPMIQKLKDKFPSSGIEVLCIPQTKELFEHSKSVSEVISYDKHGIQKSFLSFLRLIILIRQKKYSHIFSPHRSFRSSLIVYLSGAGISVGFDIASINFVYGSCVKYIKEKHEVARNLDLIGADTNNDNWKILPIVNIDSSLENNTESIIRNLTNKKIAAVAPGSVWKTKIYPGESYIEIIKFLIKKNYFVVLLGGKDDELLCSGVEKEFTDSVKSFAGKMSIIESISLLKKCSVLISNDSAPTHLGMIADIPTLTIYCSTIPAFGFSPYNAKSNYVSYDDLSCKPCGIHGRNQCPVQTFDCGYKLLPQTVFSSLDKMNL
ncbi:MAG: glycosyltransferase family 9 protein [Ignavibacteriales bacterium]|nr:glycosyltransferase family 9 protein [Ignavibacteriales bacterium]